MRVAVIGAGGIGGLYGGMLARAGHAVSFLARGPHLDAIRQRGLEIRSVQFGTFTVQTPASADAADLGPADLVLFAVKTYDLQAAAAAARPLLAPDARLLTFQNGVEAPAQVAAIVGQPHVLIGTTRVETTVLEPGVIGHLSAGHLITASEFDGPPTPRLEQLVETLTAAGLNAVVAPEGQRALWEKAAVLIPMSTVTAVCRAPFGPIRDLPETRQLITTLLDEVRAVARASGVELGDAVGPRGLTIESAPAAMTTSLARDFERGTRTELDALVGALVRLGDAHGVDVPAARTTYAILKLRAERAPSAPSTQDDAGATEALGVPAARR